jgi:hypothetical protein
MHPEESVEQAFGIKLPSDVRIHVLEDAPNQIYLILPSSAEADGETTDLGLKEVLGFASANTHVGCGSCSVTAPPTSAACGCR